MAKASFCRAWVHQSFIFVIDGRCITAQDAVTDSAQPKETRDQHDTLGARNRVITRMVHLKKAVRRSARLHDMGISVINGIRIYSEWHGEGAPVVLVHGSWGDHHNWDAVVPGLARTFRTLTYDRRGHSQSDRIATHGSIEEDVADLALLITAQNVAPAHVIGSSFGASIVLKLAAARPELFASLAVHEPPLVGLLGNDPRLAAVQQRIEAVIATLQSGRTELGAQQFVETVALGPGMWEKLPPEMRQTFVFNAPTWLDEMNEQRAFWLDVARLVAFDRPALISRGDQSPPFFGMIVDKIAETLPHARRHTFNGAGHVPHLTHPADFVSIVRGFIDSVATTRR